MSCNRCAMEATPTLASVGVPADQAMAVWADTVGMTWEYLPRCPKCKKWVSPRTGICRYAKCGLKNTQVAPASGWPPAGVKLLRSKKQVEEIRQATGQPAPLPPMTYAEAVEEAETVLAEARLPSAIEAEDVVADVERFLAEEAIAESALSEMEDPDMAKIAKPRNENDYVITDDDHIGEGGAKAKFKQNVGAIRLLKQLEEEDRDATDEEKKTLVKFVGWGGLAKVFDNENEWWSPSRTYGGKKPEWYDEHAELKELLTEDEWEAAKGSTPNAHYTSPEVVRAMWDGLKQLGFEEGTVLEPAAGVGHFLGCSPADITANTSRVAVELDSLSGRITQKLYPDSNVHICGFQDAPLPDGFFDVAISNVPFGNYPVHDAEFKGRKYMARSIHNYFFAKALDKVRPGGVVAFVTSHHTLDSENKQVREYLASQADLVGAIRLPNTAFKGNAMTEVTTDILFLRKRDEGEEPGDTSWVNTAPVKMPGKDKKKEEHPVNQYFVDHPEQMMGTLAATGTMYGPGEVTLVNDGRDMQAALSDAMQRLPKGVMVKERTRCPACRAFMSPGGPCNNPDCPTKKAAFACPGGTKMSTARDGAYVVGADGRVYRKERGRLTDIEAKPKDAERMKGLVAFRDAARKVLDLNVEGADDVALAAAQADMNTAYDGFVAEYGPITAQANRKLFEGDPDLPFMLALENDYDPDENTAKKSGMFSRRTVNIQTIVTRAGTPKDALLVSLNESGHADWARMAALTGRTEEQLQKQLAGHVYRTPSGGWATKEEYLSGDVRKKLRDAEAAASVDPHFKGNVDALKEVQPRDLLPSEINAALGSGWIPTEDVEAFAKDLFGQSIKVGYVEALGKWSVEPDVSRYFNKFSTALTSTWGTRRVNGMDLLDDALNGKIPTVYDKEDSGDGEKRVVNQPETLAAREMADKIKSRFKEWLWEDPERAPHLAARYNEMFNSSVPRQFDGSHLTLPGMGTEMPPLRAHQKDAIWRVVQSEGNSLLGHIVGAGKTWSMIGAGMELRRLGMRRKVMHCVPNHVLEQYGADFVRMYPGAKILLVSAKDLGTADKRKETMSRIATNDWDAVVVTHNAFEKLPVKDETFTSFLQQEIDTLDQYLSDAKAAEKESGGGYRRRGKSDKSKSVKEIEKAKKRLEAKLQARADRGSKDDGLTWEEMGVDQLFVDEAQNYKNLYFPTQRNRVAGIPQSESNRAFDMFIKTQYMSRRCKCGQFVGQDGVCRNCRAKTQVAGGGVCFATGTPISNSVSEMYTMQRYLQLDRLKEMGLGHFDAWASQFGDTVTALEMKPSGQGYREFTRFAKFNNVPELMRTFMEVADIQMDPDELGLARPAVAGGKPIGESAPPSPELKRFIQECARRAESLGHVDPRDDNMLKIISDANKAALDMRLIDPSLPDDPNSKVNKAVANMIQVYRDTTGVTVPGLDGPQNMAQMVFLDTSTPTDKGFNVYGDMKQKLIAAGVPEREIAFIHDATTDEAKQELFDQVNAGQVRFLFGSTVKMGSGTNAQRRLAALHHIDAPWRPSDVEQREGRILRQGNLNPEIKLYRYATEESFDVYKWQLLQSKARFIGQVMTGDLETRSVEDLDAIVIGYAEMKALATGNPVIIERIKTEGELRKFSSLRKAHQDKVFGLQRSVQLTRDTLIPEAHKRVAAAEAAAAKVAAMSGTFSIKVGGRTYGEKEREEGGKAYMEACDRFKGGHATEVVGEFNGCPIHVSGNGADKAVSVTIEITPQARYTVAPSASATGNMSILTHALGKPLAEAESERQRIEFMTRRNEEETVEMGKPFEHAKTVSKLSTRLAELDAQIAEIAKQAPKQDILDDTAMGAAEGGGAGDEA